MVLQKLLDENVFIPVVELMSNGRFKTRKYAAYVVTKAAKVSSSEQIDRLVSSGCIKPLCDLLAARDLNVVDAVLSTIAVILRHGRLLENQDGVNASDNKYAPLVEEAGGE